MTFAAHAVREQFVDVAWRRPPTNGLRVVVFTIAVVVLVAALVNHAMWLDEIQAWLIVRGAHSVAELFQNLRYDGHPALWYLLLYPLSGLGWQPEWMQVAQAACAIGTLALIVWKGPFSRLELLLVPFGYCLLFEYGVKSRSYALGNLLLFLFCALYPQRHRRPLLLASVLALLANVHALFTIVSCVALVMMLADRRPASASSPVSRSLRTDAACVGIVVAGLIVAMVTALPPPDTGYAVGWHLDLAWPHLKETATSLSGLTYDGFTPQWIDATSALGAAVILVGAARWRIDRAAAFLLVCGTSGLVAFFHVKHGFSRWHHGVLFVVLLAAMWISRARGVAAPGILPRPLFVVALCLQAVLGFQAIDREARQPYSNSRATARFIDAQGWTHAPIFIGNVIASTSVLGYLDIGKAYEAQGARWGSFVVLDTRVFEPADYDAFLEYARDIRPAATVVDCGVRESGAVAHGFIAVATFDGATTGEDCTVYRWPG